MSSFTTIYWFFLFTAELVVAPPVVLVPFNAIQFPFQPACYDTEPPILQQNLENLTCSAKCLLGAANVQILHWPTVTNEMSLDIASTTEAPVPSGIVSNGVTFISPSVYIAYHQLEAFISCPGQTGVFARGKTYNTTIAYAPEDLSASISARVQQTCAFSEINYTKLANYPFSNATDFILSLPIALSSVDPAWSTCAPASYGAFDPPKTMQKATALTDSTVESTSSTPATPGGHVGPAYGPATITSSATSSGSEVPLAAPRPATPHTAKSPTTHSADVLDPAIKQGPPDTAASESPSEQLPSIFPGKGKMSDPNDPSNTSPAPGRDGDDGDRTENKQNPPSQTSTAPAPAPGKDGPDGADPTKNKESASPSLGESGATNDSIKKMLPSLILSDPPLVSGQPTVQAPNRAAVKGAATNKVSPSIGSSAAIVYDPGYAPPHASAPLINDQSATASNGRLPFAAPSVDPGIQGTISGDPVSAGIVDATTGDNTHGAHLIQTPFTLTNGILVNPGSNPDEVRIGSQTISLDGPAVTVSGAVISLGSSGLNFPPMVATATASPRLGGLIMSASDSVRNPITAESNGPKPAWFAGGSNGSNTEAFTGGSERSGHDYSILIPVLLAIAVIVTAL